MKIISLIPGCRILFQLHWRRTPIHLIALQLFLFLLSSCTSTERKNARTIEPTFYYWKSVFHLSAFEIRKLDTLHVKTIYTKYFDIDWDMGTRQPLPRAVIRFSDTSFSAYTILPVVFITNECLQQMDSSYIPVLADKMTRLIRQVNTGNHIPSPQEIQVDCDWTATTKDKYFSLLNQLKGLEPSILFSATIRMHQVKYSGKSGIPPVNRGLLMCYNMGNLRNPATRNSILDPTELEKYTQQLSGYPLELDLAFPLFEWKVLFRDGVYRGIIEELPDSLLNNPLVQNKANFYTFQEDCRIDHYDFKKGDILRKEISDHRDILESLALIGRKLKMKHLRVSLYHLDSVLLSKIPTNELETIYQYLR